MEWKKVSVVGMQELKNKTKLILWVFGRFLAFWWSSWITCLIVLKLSFGERFLTEQFSSIENSCFYFKRPLSPRETILQCAIPVKKQQLFKGFSELSLNPRQLLKQHTIVQTVGNFHILFLHLAFSLSNSVYYNWQFSLKETVLSVLSYGCPERKIYNLKLKSNCRFIVRRSRKVK